MWRPPPLAFWQVGSSWCTPISHQLWPQRRVVPDQKQCLVPHVVDLSGPKWVGKIRLLSERRLCPVSGCFKWAMDGFTAMILIHTNTSWNSWKCGASPMSSTIPQSSPFLWFVLSPSKYGWFMARDPTRSRDRIGIAVIVDVPVLMVLGSLNLDLNFLHFFSGNKTHQWYHWYQLVGGLKERQLLGRFCQMLPGQHRPNQAP